MKPPVLVTGASRSGKSLVCDLLNESGEFALFPEPRMLWNAGDPDRDNDRLYREDLDEETVARIRGDCLRLAGEKRYLDNLAYHALQIPLVRAVFPDVRIVHVVRDYRAAVPEAMVFWRSRPPFRKSLRKVLVSGGHSLGIRRIMPFAGQFLTNLWDIARRGERRTCGPRVPGLASLPPTTSLAEIVAWQWVQLVHIAREELAQMPRELWIEISYESLLRDPVRTLDELCCRVEVHDPAKVVEAGCRDIVREGVASDREALTPEEWTAVTRIIDSVMTEDQGHKR